jgi:hypothetical protein
MRNVSSHWHAKRKTAGCFQSAVVFRILSFLGALGGLGGSGFIFLISLRLCG